MAESYSITAVLQAKVDGLVNGFKKAESTVNDFVKKNEATFESFKQVGAAATAGGVAVAGGLAFAVSKSSEFQGAMSSVAAISGATGKDLESLTKTARDWGATTSFSATEAAEGLEYMALAGWDTQQMMGGIGPILHLAEAGALDLGRASDLVTDSMAGLGLEVNDLEGYLDKVATTAANSNTDIDALMEAFVIAGGTFDRFNVPLEESTAFLGVLANRGFKASEAGTAVNAIMTRLASSTGPAAEQLKEMGISAYDSEGNFRGMEAVLEDVRVSMDGMTDAEKANAMEKLAGLNHGKTFNAMLAGLGDEYHELKGKVENSTGALEKMRDTMKDNLGGDLENLSSAFEEIAISIGDVLLPYVRDMIEFIQSLADKFNSLDDKTITVIAVIATLAAGFLLLIGPIFLLIGFIPSILAGFTALSTVIGVLTGPIGLTVAAIIAIGAALVIAYNKIEWFRDVVDAVWGFIWGVISTVVSEIKDFILEVWGYIADWWAENQELIGETVDTVWNAISKVIETVMNFIAPFLETAWENIKMVVEVVWEFMKMHIMNVLDVILGIIKATMQAINGDWEGAWETIKGIFENVWDRMKEFGRTSVENIRSTVSKGFERVRAHIKEKMEQARAALVTAFTTMVTNAVKKAAEIVTAVKTKFEEVKTNIRTKLTEAVTVVGKKIGEMPGKVREKVSDMLQAGKDLISGLIEGIINMGSEAIEAVTGVVDGVVNKAKSLLGIKSPSRVFMAIGEDTGEGWAIGIAETAKANQKAVEGVAKVITNAAKSANVEINKLQKKQAADEKAIINKKNRDIANIRAVAANKKRKLTLQEAQRIQKLEIDASAKILDIRKKSVADIAKVEQSAHKERLDAIKLYIDDKKSMEELSLVAEALVWEKSLVTFKQGTKERVDAQKAYKNAVEAVNKEITSINQEYSNKMQKINDDLKGQEEELTKAYEDAFAKRSQSLYSFAGVFDEFSWEIKVSGEELLSNLESQVEGFKVWQNEIGKLSSKAIDQGLIAELKEMGPKALPELLALNSLTDDQLNKYSYLYQQKAQLAREQAEKELVGMKEDTSKRINELRKVANEELETLREEWLLKIQDITKSTDDELMTLEQIGINAGQGLLEGLASMESSLVSKATSIANAVKNAMASALDIHSPSRWMRDMIGKNMMLGWIDGMEAMRSKVVAMAVNATGWMKPDVPVLSGVNLPSFKNPDLVHSRSISKGTGSLGSVTHDNRVVHISVDAHNIEEVQQVIKLFTGLKQANNAR